VKKKPVIIGGLVIVGLCALVYPRPYLEDPKLGRVLNDLVRIGRAVQLAAETERITPTDWGKINDLQTLAPYIRPVIEEGEDILIDPWGNQYILEKRDEEGRIIITVRSSHQVKELKGKVLGIEITIWRPDGKVTSRKKLWLD
jgi:hypothetical protein